MIRWMLAAVVSLTFLSPAMASLARKERPDLRGNLPARIVESLPADSTADEYRVTERTEVLLDGRPCRYEQVPDGVTIIFMEIVSNEDREVLRLHFQTTPHRRAPVTAGSR